MNQNSSTVTNSEIRVELHQYIDLVDDSFLQAVHGLVTAYLQKDQVIGYQADGTVVMARDFVDHAEKMVSSMESGESGISVKELERRSNQWLSPTK